MRPDSSCTWRGLFVDVVRKRGDEWETPDAVENDDGGLSAPLMYASLVLGMVTVWKKDRNAAAQPAGEEAGGAGVLPGADALPDGEVSRERRPVWNDRVSRDKLGGRASGGDHVCCF